MHAIRIDLYPTSLSHARSPLILAILRLRTLLLLLLFLLSRRLSTRTSEDNNELSVSQSARTNCVRRASAQRVRERQSEGRQTDRFDSAYSPAELHKLLAESLNTFCLSS